MPSHRHTLRRLLAAMLALLCATVPHRAYSQQKNILLIIADDLGADSFPLTAGTGASLPPMPNITALKNSGVLFTNARAHPTCSPTRASMLTGRHPFRTGIGAQLTGAASPQLQTAEFTLPDAFAANAGLGYSLAMFGKWHLNAGPGTNDTPRTVGGWPHFAGTIIGALPDYSAWTKITNGTIAATTAYATTDTINDAAAWIDARGTTPWFAWVALNAPHAPLHFPPNELHSYDAAPATDRNHFEAMCEAMDTEVGRLLTHVNLATTHVIFIGDNGTPQNVIQPPYTGAHAKGTLYDGGTRVPLIIAGPGVVSPNRTSTAPVNCVDLYATILELAGINVTTTQPAANPIDARSLTPILRNFADGTRFGFSETFAADLLPGESGRAVTDAAGYKLIQFLDGSERLYRTATDLNEGTNLLGPTISLTAQTAYGALKLQLANYQTDTNPNKALISSWFTANSGEYARIYPTLAAMNTGASVTTWSRGAGVQSLPTYAGVHEVDYSADWVYIRTTGLGSHVMGPWYIDAAKQTPFPNYPSNTAAKFRFPRTPVIPATKTLFGGGTVGYFVDGVSLFDIRDAFYWNGTTEVQGAGNWNRDAFVNEGVTFDNAGAHQAGNNHHYHASPKGLRHLLGDHVDYHPETNVYTERTGSPRHSPILAWVRDGLPLYGPYGYSDPMDAGSPIRRMRSGFVIRNGQNGTTTGRATIPLWASRAYGVPVNQPGPAISDTHPLGRYLEDNEYLGDLGFTPGVDFDLNEYNVRFCKTPEFPEGTWAYFLCIAADGMPVFPYQVGRSYYGSPLGGTVMTITEPVATSFIGGPVKGDDARPISVNTANGNVTLTWSAVEGGIYTVQAATTLPAWGNIATNVVATGDDAGILVETNAANAFPKRFYQVTRTGLSAYHSAGFPGLTAPGNLQVNAPGGTVSRGTVVDVTITLTGPPGVPPQNVTPNNVTLAGTITGTAYSRPSATQVKATLTIPANAPTGAQNIVVTFPGPSYTLTGALTIQ